MNIFRLLGDSSHVLAFLILLFKIISTRNVSGISGKSRILFALVYITRYLDLFTVYVSEYNFIMKLLFIAASLSILVLIYIAYRKTYQAEHDTFRMEILIIAALVLAVLIHHDPTTLETLWAFSIYLEAVAILPQLFMLLKIYDVDRLIIFYLITLGLYRGLYCMNWIYRYVTEGHYDFIAIAGGVVQTAIYVVFFSCFYRRRPEPIIQIGENYKNNIAVIPVEEVVEKKPADPVEAVQKY